MKINKDDLTDNTSLTFKLLEEISDYVNYLHGRADKMEELADSLVYYIREGIITDTDTIMAARSWFINRPSASIYEIFDRVIRGNE